jgi:hypothetical protein
LITEHDACIVTDNIEAPRMREEQTPSMNIEEHPWHEGPDSLLRELTGDAGMGTDVPFEHGWNISAEIAPLRYVLDEEAIESYRRLGADTVAAMSEVADSLSSETDEREAAVNLTQMVYFDNPGPETARRQQACQEILRRMREEATKEE